jgi:2-polyprenyl-3-methyl-5-hydroxy-6-metoxy-1,4-benzoquinol methylase
VLDRTNCVICHGKLPKTLKTIPSFPIHMGTSNLDLIEDIHKDQFWTECLDCGCLQLSKLIPIELLYVNNHNDVVGATWKRHHENFADFILQGSIKSVCEIGAAHGYLSNLLLKQRNFPYSIIEPTDNKYASSIRHVRGFVEENLDLISECNTIIHSHVLEHVYNPVDFLSSIANKMSMGANLFISFPNIERLIEIDGSNALNFEHTYYLHPLQLDFILKSLNFDIIEIKKFEQHSFFYWLKKREDSLELDINIMNLPNISRFSEKWYKFWNNLDLFTKGVNSNLHANDIPTYLFGAHIFSQTLAVLGIKKERIIGVLDNSSNKQGQRLYGTPWTVLSPQVITGMDSVQVVLKASHYQDEIKEQLKRINPKVIILE